jgi:PAS domain S-box-containing protein
MKMIRLKQPTEKRLIISGFSIVLLILGATNGASCLLLAKSAETRATQPPPIHNADRQQLFDREIECGRRSCLQPWHQQPEATARRVEFTISIANSFCLILLILVYRLLQGHLNRREQEIVEHRQTKDALRLSERRYRSVVAACHQMIWTSDVAGKVVASPSLQTFTGQSEAEVFGWCCLSSIHPDDRERVKQDWIKALATKSLYETEYRVRRWDGSYRNFSVRGMPVLEDDGSIREWVGTCDDITESRYIERMRVSLGKQKELSDLWLRFFSMASHDFRTPLGTILFAVEILGSCNERWLDEKILRNINRIRTAAEELKQFLEDILMLNRLEVGLTFTPKFLNLTELCRRSIEDIQLATVTGTHIDFVHRGESDSSSVDEKLLRPILSNLLSNAVKYSPAGSTVSLILTCESDKAVFQICDRGIGIPPEIRSKLFEPFQRGENIGNVPGSGLGLAIVKKCVELHEGSIAVKSEIGVGTTFTVTIPLDRARSASSPVPSDRLERQPQPLTVS